MYNSNLKGIAMRTNELRDIAIYFKSKGISPTIKELCSNTTASIYLAQYRTEHPHS